MNPLTQNQLNDPPQPPRPPPKKNQFAQNNRVIYSNMARGPVYAKLLIPPLNPCPTYLGTSTSSTSPTPTQLPPPTLTLFQNRCAFEAFPVAILILFTAQLLTHNEVVKYINTLA